MNYKNQHKHIGAGKISYLWTLPSFFYLLMLTCVIQAQNQFADVVIDEYYDPRNINFGSYFFGSDPARGCNYYPTSTSVALGNNNRFVSLPTGSYIVLGFTDNIIFNAPGQNDIFIDEIGAASELGTIWVSSDFGQTFTLLGTIDGGRTNAVDLEDIQYRDCVNAIKIQGSDAQGCVPGFDVVRVYGLPGANIDRSILTREICEGESFEGYSETGIYRDTFPGNFGCDSIRTLNLIVGEEYDVFDAQTICAGQVYSGYQNSGLYLDTLETIYGCDSIRLLDLTVTPATRTTDQNTICEGESYQGYTTTGTFIDTLNDINGCDSIRTLTLTVLESPMTFDSTTICEGESYLGYTASGDYLTILTAANGCDSTHIVSLTVLSKGPFEEERIICEGERFEEYSRSGNYTDTLQNFLGCDSIRVLTLDVKAPEFTTVDTLICAGRSYQGYNESGFYEDLFANRFGCDSTRTLFLEVSSIITSMLDTAICAGNMVEGYTATGIYQDTFAVSEVCDSVRILNLQVTDITMPNIFSPNGDNVNDLFMVKGTTTNTRIESMSVYDRWGTKVFEAESFLAGDPSYAWDGMLNGRPLSDGVYIYHIEVACEEGILRKTGDITILK